MAEPSKPQRAPLSLNWNSLLPNDDSHAPPPDILIVKPSSDMGPEEMTDRDLFDSIHRKKQLLASSAMVLKDGGAKLRTLINQLEEELARRQQQQQKKKKEEKEKEKEEEVVDVDRRPKQVAATSTTDVGMHNDLAQDNESPPAPSQSAFTSCFVQKMNDDSDHTAANAFSEDLSHFKHCNNQIIRENGASKGRKRHRTPSRFLPFRCRSNLSKCARPKHDKSYSATSTHSQQNTGKNMFRRKSAPQAIQSESLKSRKGQPIILDDDDDGEETYVPEKIEEESKLPECLKEAKIYYPTRDNPECVEVCYQDIDCLGPEGYLTSTIMNFYLLYLKQQASLANRSLSDYHFFNTFFYKKLKEAVSSKRSDKETFFAKFRRWWRGVNIFQKPYILIPIHEDLHWSLIIICIPDKEDDSGPIILHLDSLGLHSSRSVFDNIKCYLLEEKNYLDRECLSSDVPIAERIWKCLPRRIETLSIAVPQQKNEYDCGLFVLYFMERFIEEAPERLKRKDIAMFGKQWFKPEEASSLRVKIRKLLVTELQNSISECSPSYATKCIDTAKELD